MKIATINQRCVYNRDGIQSFIHRGVFLCDKIEAEAPDVIGFQEVTPQTLKVLERLLPEYVFVGQFRSENYDGEGLFTAVRRSTCTVLGFETIWLSPTPYVPGSRYENQSKYPRICVETKVLHRASKRVFRLYNVHLDHISEEAKRLGIEQTLGFIDSFKDGAPVVLLGDFNALPESETMKKCNAREDLRDVTADISVTSHGYGQRANKIDYIYMSNELADRVVKVEAWTEKSADIWLSDHYPVCAELDL